MKKKIIIVTGDPVSINSEIIFKCWRKLNNSIKNKIYFISNKKLLESQFKKLKYSINVETVKSINQQVVGNKLKVLDVAFNFKDPFRINKKVSSKFVLSCLNYAHYLSLNKNVIGLINCPIDKNLLNKSNIGVTEYLAKKCGGNKDSVVMLIFNKKLSVCPITTHMDIKKISNKIKSSAIIKKVKKIDTWYKKNFQKKPKIAILGLNPHNAELRKNSEEKKQIIPAILKLKKLKMRIFGPLSADTVFINHKKYNVIVGMYHDQVLGPFKTLFKFDAINLTLGLKYIRNSPDHGTAIQLIGKNKANYESLMKCIYFLNNLKK